MRKRWIALWLVLLTLAALAAAATYFFHQSSWLETRVKATLLTRGITFEKLSIDLPKQRWAAEGIRSRGSDMPPAKAEGGFTLNVQGRQLTVHIARASVPFGGGEVYTEKVDIPLYGERALPLTLKLDRVELGQLLPLVAGGKAKGTGTLSGALPVTILRNGDIVIGSGEARAPGDGTISIGPDVLPGGSEQLDQVKRALQNFHYTRLQIHVSSPSGQKPVILLALEGNNPDAFEGRTVKLNIRLSGDVESLIRGTLLPLADPAELLKETK